MSPGDKVRPWVMDKMNDEDGVGGGGGRSKQMFLIDYRDSGT